MLHNFRQKFLGCFYHTHNNVGKQKQGLDVLKCVVFTMVKSNIPNGHMGGTGSGGAPSTFIGFGAFAAAPTTPNPSQSRHTSATNHPTTTTTATTSGSDTKNATGSSSNYTWTPVYMGHDDTFRALFVRIYQKREPITIVKALQEVQSHIIDLYDKNIQNKKVLVEAMKHFAYLYYHKLSIGSFTTSTSNRTSSGSDTVATTDGSHTKNDGAATTTISTMMISTSSIRANALKIWFLFYKYIPKAVMHVCYNHVEILGLIYAAQTDPASEVRNIASQPLLDEPEQPDLLLHPLMLKTSTSKHSTFDDTKWQKCWDDGIIAYTTTRMLSCSKPIMMLEALCGHTTTVFTIASSQQHQQQQRSKNTITLNEQQRDVVDELYIRLVGNCLDSIGQWLQLGHQYQQQSDRTGSILITWEIFNMWFKPFLSYGATSTSSVSSKSNHQQPHTVRRKSYQLITVITTHASHIYDSLDMDNTTNINAGGLGSSGLLQKILLLAFSVEKDPVNIPYLFESTLSLSAYYYKRNRKNCSEEENSTNDLLLLLLKPLMKLISKACYGAKVEIWGPMMLPLIGGQYSKLHEQHQLLASLQVGIPFTYSLNEKYHLWIALCETSSLILLRSTSATLTNTSPALPPTLRSSSENSESNHDAIIEAAKNIAMLWVDGFQFFLSALSNLPKTQRRTSFNKTNSFVSSTEFNTNATEGQNRLLQNISNQLIQYHQATTEQKVCLFTSVPHLADWFWADGIAIGISKTSHLLSLVQLIQELELRQVMSINTKRCPVLSEMIPILKARFHLALQDQQTSSSSVPSSETYEYFQSVLSYCGQDAIFEKSVTSSSVDDFKQTSLEQFVMNDLLRWSIIHTSSLETEQRHERSSLLVQQDFALLSTCLNGLQETKVVVWKSFVREIIRADCDIEFLSDGLSTLARNQGSLMLDFMPCDEFDDYVKDIEKIFKVERNSLLDIGETCDVIDRDDKEFNTASKTQKFLRICLGSDENDFVLVSMDVIATWIDYVSRSSNLRKPSFSGLVLILSLLEALRRKKDIFNGDQIKSMLKSSWHLTGYPYIKSLLMEILNDDALLRNTFQTSAEQQLRSDFQSYVSSTVSHKTEKNWAERVWFLFELDHIEISSFPLLGFECVDTWERNPTVAFRLAMSLLNRVTGILDRQKLVKTWATNDPADFTTELLSTISEASTDFSLATKCKSRDERSASFLNAIGGKSLDTDFVDGLAFSSIDKISKILKTQVNDKSVQRRIAVLCLILEIKFQREAGHYIDLDALAPEEIKEKDSLWYITDPKNPQNREEVQVVKVHFDSTSGFFFSILVKRNGEYIERQTVIERLRKQQRNETERKDTDVNLRSANDEERKNMCRLIWNKLLANYTPYVAKHNLGEIIHVLVTRIGLGDERGIGSVYYEVFQLLRSIEKHICGATNNTDYDKLKKLLWTMSLAHGFGMNSPGSLGHVTRMWDPSMCVTAVLDFYKEHDVGRNNELDAATAAFLTTLGCLEENCYDNIVMATERIVLLLFRIGASLLTNATHATIEMTSLLAYHAISQGISLINQTTLNGSPVKEALKEALHVAIQSFSDSELLEQPDSVQPHIRNIVSTCSTNGTDFRHILSEVCISNSYALCNCLFIPRKRSIAFSLLELVAAQGKENANTDVVLSLETTLTLKEWTDESTDEDAAILEEDVYIVAEWLPSRLMVEMEGWENAGFEMENEPTIIGRLLSWFCVLRFIEAAAPQNFRNRPAFINYLERCNAAYSILNLGLLHNEIINNNRLKHVPVIDEVSAILLSIHELSVTQLATLSLFRTVEVLPSLCRRWWENDCPRVYAGAVQVLVESFVAPEIFKREIDRMRTSTLFGKMTVSANVTSREITATYVQDDFTLKVIILLPSAFPFRSAEVDCSKTLGVPQSRWKRWSLQITMMLNSQGGTLQDALLLWKDNVDKEFEGVEPCPVCYSVLHVKSHKLPILQCKTCNNRFHAECLTEWFRSSGKSQCVLCQQPWQGTRI